MNEYKKFSFSYGRRSKIGFLAGAKPETQPVGVDDLWQSVALECFAEVQEVIPFGIALDEATGKQSPEQSSVVSSRVCLLAASHHGWI